METLIHKHAKRILQAALRASDPYEAVLRHARMQGSTLLVGRRRYPLDAFRNVYVIGAGKASAEMARALEKLLGKRISGGLVNVKYGHTVKLRRIELNECGHPVPDERGVAGASRILTMAREASEQDLLLAVISGGASALLPAPAAPITLDEKQATTQLLLRSGATIHEVNAVRKHISSIKGGRLSAAAYPATVVTLLLSDVIGDDLDVIGSGPTAPDASTYQRAWEVLEKHGIAEQVPAAVRERIRGGVAGRILETPKPGSTDFDRTHNVVVGSNELAVNAAVAEARALGWRTLVLSTFVEGETREVARVHAAIAKEILKSSRPLKAPACVISGGETTVTIRGEGLGGRNQEFALAAAIEIAGLPQVAVLSAGTDGTDGPTDAAGAIADGGTVRHALSLGLDAVRFLNDNDSYHFFEKAGGLLKTGPTRTNVMDVRLVMVGAPPARVLSRRPA